MNENLLALEPALLWKNFRELTLIPRPSKHEERVTKFLLEFGKKHADEAFQDKAGNVIMRKKATPGMEKRKSIVLQAHCDMVPQKRSDKIHDFTTDPITTIVEDGFVKADGTTLGGDDGMGVAAIMAVFEDKTLKHGPLEALITVDEETGLTGADKLEKDALKSEILINLDSEEDNIFYIGCAGGVNVHITKQLQFENVDSSKYEPFKLILTGFLGGHSGSDIHKNRPNAAKLLFRFINGIIGKVDFRLSGADSGDMHNAIPRDARAFMLINKEDVKKIEREIKKFQKSIDIECGNSDPDGKISIEKLENLMSLALSEQSLKDVNFIINSLVSGVFAMSADMPGLVETSNNLSIMRISGGTLRIQCLLRSSVQSQSDYLKDLIRLQAEYAGAKCEFEGEYPGWKPNTNSPILDLSKRLYINEFGAEPVVTAIHAGLECGLILGKYPKMDMISLGPSMSGVHTPDEKVEIASTVRFMKLLRQILETGIE
ncbi:MAG: aminoacyl-histidine dipeptidase [Bacteroidales bacterium]|nr:aminoacyl-histidine dipeptidase [Bacteroidales bacterium]